MCVHLNLSTGLNDALSLHYIDFKHISWCKYSSVSLTLFPSFNSKLGLPAETLSSSSSPKERVSTSPQVSVQIHPELQASHGGACRLPDKLCVFSFRSASQTLSSLTHWHPRKRASPTSATEGRPHLHPPPPPPPLTAARTRAAPALSARPYLPMSPRALPPISLSRPTLLHPLTSSPAQPPTPTRPAPQRAVAPRTCPWTRVRPAETPHPAPSLLTGPCKNATGTMSLFPRRLPPQALLPAPRSQLPPLSSPALLCPAVPTRSLKRSPRSPKRRTERGRKGSGWREAARVLLA